MKYQDINRTGFRELDVDEIDAVSGGTIDVIGLGSVPAYSGVYQSSSAGGTFGLGFGLGSFQMMDLSAIAAIDVDAIMEMSAEWNEDGAGEFIDTDGDGELDTIVVTGPDRLPSDWDALSFSDQAMWYLVWALNGGGDAGALTADVAINANISGTNPDDPYTDPTVAASLMADTLADAINNAAESLGNPYQ